ncbi:hypothetical protein ACFYTQ_07820 [Nocardia sp. NPDC004068]|uniref:hypothetical protein n=1 Tax=Nocardia sp. NPDC004068 TaxID=3364303 RepID=UPI0036BABECC
MPTHEIWTLVDDKKEIKRVAAAMISGSSGLSGETFAMDLEEGRVLASPDEFVLAFIFAQHWNGVSAASHEMPRREKDA